jgi:putative ABC transport system permease protein
VFTSVFEIMRLAIRCLGANVLRSLLTLLGIIIGVASVIFMMSVTAGAGRKILEEMQQLGLRNLIVNSVEPSGDIGAGGGRPDRVKKYGLTGRDIEQIRATCPGLEFVTEAHEIRDEVWRAGEKVDVRVLGVQQNYFDALRLHPAAGRALCDLDNDERRFVCNVSSRILDDLGVVGERLGTDFEIDYYLFRVVGVLDEPRYTSRNKKALATNSKLLTMYVPADTALRYFGTQHIFRREGEEGGVSVEVDQAIVRVREGYPVITAADAVRQVLETNHPQRDYEMIVPLELLNQEKKTQQVFNITMILIASISLVVGGIGIINIMLATVTERTREIGIRRACGAKRHQIAYQFLVETTTLSLLGGVIGALLGIASVHVVAPQIGWPAEVTTESLALALGISCAVGIIFGTYPAVKASRMDPIEALRFE